MADKGILDLLEQVKAKAWVDGGFRKALIAEPKKVIEELFGITLPEQLNFNILEEKPNCINLTLPAKPDGELGEEELDSVTGGKWCYCKASCFVVEPKCFEISCKS